MDNQAMTAQPSEAEILDALRGSGYLMEQEVAATFVDAGFHVETNRAYQDIDEGKSREIDVSGIRRIHHDEVNKVAVFLEVIRVQKQ